MPSKTSLPKSKKDKLANDLLTFVTGGNAKLPPEVATFSLLSGHTCPGAKTCLAKVNLVTDETTGKTRAALTEGPHATIRCFSAVQELAFRSLFLARQRNFDLLRKAKTAVAMADLLHRSMDQVKHLRHVRVHVGGDFFNQQYFDAWMLAAQRRPAVQFYAYTKSIPFYLDYIKRNGAIPKNFEFTLSEGGKFDHLIPDNARTATIVSHPDEAKAMNLEVDHDDSHARSKRSRKSFALLVHGQQKAGSPAMEAIKRMKREGVKFGYSKL